MVDTTKDLLRPMNEIPKPLPSSPQPANLSVPAAANPAIAHCLQAYTAAFEASMKKADNKYIAGPLAKTAYRSALPPLSGSRNIRDYVACVAHAMALEVIDPPTGARMLYAAQVANAAQSTQRRIKAKSIAITVPQSPQNQQLPNAESPVTNAQ
ncbi:MAG TPA: hypothetical protein VHZ52_11185 [Acidobacteriaceae bacterium]|jgi:hypothetical protein|nr:hypothetical protein [Acidobacteriaceae bacterium]